MAQTPNRWLVLTEKPSVAGDIARSLGGFTKTTEHYESDEYIITWAVGHLMELLAPEDIDPKFKRWRIQDLPIIPEPFCYKPKVAQKARLAGIRKLARQSDVVGLINACDAGREGELIFREIFDYCEVSKPTRRLWLQSMTAKSICQEFSKLRDGAEFDFLGDAARCRSESDWLIGMNATRAMTRRLAARGKRSEPWSIGRVQTPTLALVVKREAEILRHRSEPYWNIEGQFSANANEYTGTWFDPQFKKPSAADAGEDAVAQREKDDRIFSSEKLKAFMDEIEMDRGNAQAWETRKESREIAPQLFDLTSLQREANRRFGISASRTLQAAQRLYERHKLITYPRTDSRYLPDDYREVCQQVIQNLKNTKKTLSKYCSEVLERGFLNEERIFNGAKVSDHFAIIPTGEESPEKNLTGDDGRIFELITKRFLAAFYPHAMWAKVERITRIGSHHFRTRAQDLQIPGWREVYGLETEEVSRLPALSSEQNTSMDNPVAVDCLDAKSVETATRPLPRYSEARLLSLMENCGKSLDDEDMAEALREKGIGTPATRAEIIENLISREYMQRFGRSLKPTVKGIRLVDVLSRIPVQALAGVELSGEMEFELREVEHGRKSRADFMTKMSNFTREIVDKAVNFSYDALYSGDGAVGRCPACGKGDVCENFWNYKCKAEECTFVIWKEKNQRYVDRSLIAELLQKERVGPLEFITNSGNIYQALLSVTPLGLVMVDEQGNYLERAPGTAPTILGEYDLETTYFAVPAKMVETDVAYQCHFESTSAKGRKRVARMPKTLCQRPVSLEEFRNFCLTGQTEPILDFVSKKGRKFAAVLHMKDDASFEFRFVSRKKKAEEGGGEATDTTKNEEGGKAPAEAKKKASRAAAKRSLTEKAASESGAKPKAKVKVKVKAKAKPKAKAKGKSESKPKTDVEVAAEPVVAGGV